MTRIRATFIALIIASVALAAYGDRISGNGPEFMPRDPGAARKNLSNVDAATGRSALGLGTMASEASTDYVATDTFTGHTGDKANPHEVTYTQTGALASSAKAVDSDKLDGLDSTDYVATSTLSAHVIDNSDVHGCTAIASASAVADALSAANASDALLLRLDGSRAMTGSLKFTGNYGLLQSTDDKYTTVGGGSTYATANGAMLHAFGNTYAGLGGSAYYFAGNVSTGNHVFCTGAALERFRIGYDGKLTAANYLLFSSNYGIARATSDNSDNSWINICGGGAEGSSRGGTIQVFGNEMGSSLGGCIRYDTGNVTGTRHIFRVKDVSVLMVGDNVLIGTTTDDGANKLQVNGGAKITGTFESTGAATVGGDLTVTGASTNFRNAIKAVDGAGSGLDADTVPNATPASASATGTAGSIRYDANYIYICVAANTWKRVAISTW